MKLLSYGTQLPHFNLSFILKNRHLLLFIQLQRNFWWTYPLTMSALLTPTIMALTIIAENRARRDYELRLIEKNQREVSFHYLIIKINAF